MKCPQERNLNCITKKKGLKANNTIFNVSTTKNDTTTSSLETVSMWRLFKLQLLLQEEILSCQLLDRVRRSKGLRLESNVDTGAEGCTNAKVHCSDIVEKETIPEAVLCPPNLPLYSLMLPERAGCSEVPVYMAWTPTEAPHDSDVGEGQMGKSVLFYLYFD